jgi:hypothetical protein
MNTFKQLTDIEYLRPVAVEGETVFSCVLFLPLSLLGVVAAALARAAFGGVSCSFSAASCHSVNNVPLHPISLGISTSGLHHHSARKPWVAIAGCTSSSGLHSESIYDVIAAGGLPFVIDLPECPKYTLHAVLRPLLARIHGLAFLQKPAAALSKRVHIVNGPQTVQYVVPSRSEEHHLASLARELHLHARATLAYEAIAKHVVNMSLGTEALRSLRPHPSSFMQRRGRRGANKTSATPSTPPAFGSSRGVGSDRSTERRLRVLILAQQSLDMQTFTIRKGLGSLGAEVHSPFDKSAGDSQWTARMRQRREKDAASVGMPSVAALTAKSMPKVERVEELVASHARAPYSLVIVQLGDDGLYAELAAIIAALQPRPKGTGTGTGRAAPNTKTTRVACVRGDDSPPPVWRMWVPQFCHLVFVRDMRLW